MVQHHDAVTGTEMQHVAFDYAMRLSRGAHRAASATSAALRTLVGGAGEWTRCELLNVSVCQPTQDATRVHIGDDAMTRTALGANGSLEFAVYNPLAQARTATIHLPVHSSSIVIRRQSSQQALALQVVPSPHPVTNYATDNSGAAAPLTAVFQTPLEPMSLTTFTLSGAVDPTTTPSVPAPEPHAARPVTSRPTPVAIAGAASSGVRVATIGGAADGGFTLENEYFALSFDAHGALSSVVQKGTGTSVAMRIDPRYYVPHYAVGTARESDQPSGAYIFRPNSSAPVPIRPSGAPLSFVRVGGPTDLVQEVRQVWAEWTNLTIRLTRGARAVEVALTAGPLPSKNGTELVMHVATDIATNGSLYTDSNGRDMMHRQRNHRPTWSLNMSHFEAAAGNYYPATTAAYVRDERMQLTLLVDAPQGVASLSDGCIEVMAHRRLVQDDARGVGEPLNETEYTAPYAQLAIEASASAEAPSLGARGATDGVSTAADRQNDAALKSPLTDSNGVRVGLSRTGGGKHSGRGLIIRAHYWLSLEPPASSAAIWRPLQDAIYAPAQAVFRVPGVANAHGSKGVAATAPPSTTTGKATAPRLPLALPAPSFLARALPVNVQIITLRWMPDGGILLRLAHQFGIGEDAKLALPISLDLRTLFSPAAFVVESAVETSLTTNQLKSKMLARRAANAAAARAVRAGGTAGQAGGNGMANDGAWVVEGEPNGMAPHDWRRAPPLDWEKSTAVTLGPLEIKTFLLSLQKDGVRHD